MTINTATITKDMNVEAAHQLPNHDGKCKNLHGHSYQVHVAITGNIESDHLSSTNGMVMDYGIIKKVVMKYDHTYLNEFDIFQGLMDPPTAENFAQVLAYELGKEAEDFYNLEKIKIIVKETGSTSAIIEMNEFDWNEMDNALTEFNGDENDEF